MIDPGSTIELGTQIIESWKLFAKHARGCSECAHLYSFVCRSPENPPYDLVKTCCDEGGPLAETWLVNISASVEAFKDRFGF